MTTTILVIMPKRRHHRKQPRLLKDDVDSDTSDDEDDPDVHRQGEIIYFHCDVSTKNVLQLIRALNAATCHAFTHNIPHITLYVHSLGGCAFAGLSAYDHIRNCRLPVHTVADGFVASAATLICLAGAKRYAHRHACLLIHELSTGMSGKLAELVEEVGNSKVTMRIIRSVYEERTSVPITELKAMLKKESMLPFERAKELGFVEGEPFKGVQNTGTQTRHTIFGS
jgi:ATP-dependent Clp protease, protease subunit